MKQLYVFLLCFFALVLVSGKVEAQPTIEIDPSFNIGTGAIGLNVSVHSIALQPDGKILAGGDFTTFNGTTQNRLVRLNSDGSLDTSFNIGTGFNYGVTSITLQPDGKILVGGYLTTFNGATQNRLVRLNSDGTLDTSFNIGTGFNNYVISITLQPDGKILVGGHFTTFNGTTQNRLVRLNSDGTLDTSFDLGTGFNYGVISITLQPDGKILVGGNFAAFNDTAQNRITRLNSDGTLDTSFNIGTGINGYYIQSITLQPDGKILVGGNFTAFNDTAQNSITRLNSDGTLDTSFNTGTGFYDSGAFSIVLQPDEKILVGGAFSSFNGTTQRMITRLNSDGTLDTCFNTGIGFHDGDYASWVYSVALQPDGKILVGGLFKKYNGTTQNRITRLQELACENPPTPTVEVHQPDCFSPAELGGAIIVESPLGSQYQYSVNGVDYQESPSFLNLPPGTYQVTVKEGCCISEPLEVVINSLSIFPEPLEAEVVQPTCNNPYGSITVTSPVTFPAGTYSINGGVNYQDNPMFENLLPGTYQVLFKNGFETCVTEIMEVTINSVPSLPTPEATVIPIPCTLIPEDMGTLVVTYPLGDEYEYSIDGINYQSSPVFPNLWSNGSNFQLTVKMGDCISEPLEISNIEQSTIPVADVIQPDCSDIPESGQLGTITVTFPLGDMFQYSIDGVNYQDNPVFFNVLPDTYELTFRYYESENCVSDSFEVSIFALDIPDIPTVIVTQPDCDNPYGSIEVTSPNMDYPPYTYSINGVDYQVGPIFENLPSGTYQVTAQLFGAGCPSDPLEVNIHFPPAIPDTPTVIILQPDCYNPFGSITITSPIDEGNEFTPNYEYSINGVDYHEFTLFNNLSNGIYYVTVRHLMSGCISDPLEIVIDEFPEISINLVTICKNENHFMLKAETQEQNYQYVWNTGETTPEIEINEIGEYSVIVSLGNCSKEFSINIDAIPCMIPKGISPNRDFKNDEFDLSEFGTVSKIEIFSRYGTKVYSQSNYTNQWKGQTNHGKELPTGIYYYLIYFQNGTTKTGWIYLNRG